MANHNIAMIPSKDSRNKYGITHSSLFVYHTSKSHSPTRIDVWDNTGRPNPDLGKQLGDKLRNGNVVTSYSERYTRGAYLDPQNEPTDARISILISPESTIMTSDGTNTGTIASGQVYDSGVLRPGDTVTLHFTDGTTRDVSLHFTNNGHGHAS